MKYIYDHNNEHWFYEELFTIEKHDIKLIVNDTQTNIPSPKLMELFEDLLINFENLWDSIKTQATRDFKVLDNDLEHSDMHFSITPFHHDEIIEICFIKKNTSHPFAITNIYNGTVIDNEESESLSSQRFRNQDGLLFENIKFVESPNQKCSLSDIKDFEHKVNCKLPEEYKRFLIEVNGGIPVIDNLDEDEVPSFASLNTGDINLTEWNLEGDLIEYVKLGFITIADAGQGFGGHTSIYCKNDAHYGKVFSWYWDDLLITDEPIDSSMNKSFLKEHIQADNFIEFLKNYK